MINTDNVISVKFFADDWISAILAKLSEDLFEIFEKKLKKYEILLFISISLIDEKLSFELLKKFFSSSCNCSEDFLRKFLSCFN